MNTFSKMTFGAAILLSSLLSLSLSACGGSDNSENESTSNTEQNETNELSDEQSNSDFHPSSVGMGGPSPILFDVSLNGNQMTFSMTLKEDTMGLSYPKAPLAASMIFADDAGRLLTLMGGECRTFDLEQGGLNMTVTFNPDEDFTYATFRTFIFKKTDCVERMDGTFLMERFDHVFKNEAGNIRFIDENEFYAHSASQEGK